MKKWNKIKLSGMVAMFFTLANPVSAMQALDDNELANTEAQALMSLSYIAPTDTENTERMRTGTTNIGFYRLGMEAEIDLNTNIKKLQLGCGGRNGADGCDLDFDNLSISGLRPDGSFLGMTRQERVTSSAKLTNPFLEFAIRNPDSASTREIVGLRLSAEDAIGLLTVGENGPTPNGINSLSGYLKIAPTTGHVMTTPALFGKGPAHILRGGLDASGIPLCTSGCGNNPYNSFYTDPNHPNTTGLSVASLRADFRVPATTVSGSRLKSAVIKNVESTRIDDMAITPASGRLQLKMDTRVSIIGLINMSEAFIQMNTKVKNLKANITFDQSLGLIHNLPLSGGGFYLSLQEQDLRWPGANADDVAKPGWWMSLQKPVELGYVQANNTVDISSVYPQIANQISVFLSRPENITSINMGEGIQALVSGGLQKTLPDIILSTPAYVNMQNIPLADMQNVTPNCWGTLRFC